MADKHGLMKVLMKRHSFGVPDEEKRPTHLPSFKQKIAPAWLREGLRKIKPVERKK